jgi:hypothetical protein
MDVKSHPISGFESEPEKEEDLVEPETKKRLGWVILPGLLCCFYY